MILPLVALTDTVASGLLHAPPPGVFVRMVIAPGQTNSVPPKVDGSGSTDMAAMDNEEPQLLEVTYETFTIPEANPVSMPLLLIVALAVLEDVQVPEPELDKAIVVPTHTPDGPVIGPGDDGNAETVVAKVAATVPQPLVTV